MPRVPVTQNRIQIEVICNCKTLKSLTVTTKLHRIYLSVVMYLRSEAQNCSVYVTFRYRTVDHMTSHPSWRYYCNCNCYITWPGRDRLTQRANAISKERWPQFVVAALHYFNMLRQHKHPTKSRSIL
jgi:hypothetical protein